MCRWLVQCIRRRVSATLASLAEEARLYSSTAAAVLQHLRRPATGCFVEDARKDSTPLRKCELMLYKVEAKSQDQHSQACRERCWRAKCIVAKRLQICFNSIAAPNGPDSLRAVLCNRLGYDVVPRFRANSCCPVFHRATR